MQQEDDRHIDRTKWIGDNEPVILPARKRARNVIAVEGDRGGRQYHSVVYPLDFYVARGYLTDEQYRAGDRLRRIFNCSILRERYVRMNYGDVGGTHDFENIPLAPRDFIRAMESVYGQKVKAIVRDVCCSEVKAGKRGEMELLRKGLDDLARHFRIRS